MAVKPTSRTKSSSPETDPLDDDDRDLEDEGDGEEEAVVEAAPVKPGRAPRPDPRKGGPIPHGEFRWEDPSSLRQLDAKWILLWFVIPIAITIAYGVLVQN